MVLFSPSRATEKHLLLTLKYRSNVVRNSSLIYGEVDISILSYGWTEDNQEGCEGGEQIGRCIAAQRPTAQYCTAVLCCTVLHCTHVFCNAFCNLCRLERWSIFHGNGSFFMTLEYWWVFWRSSLLYKCIIPLLWHKQAIKQTQQLNNHICQNAPRSPDVLSLTFPTAFPIAPLNCFNLFYNARAGAAVVMQWKRPRQRESALVCQPLLCWSVLESNIKIS